MLSATLIAVALLAGIAGSWSPCGLSMVDTLAPSAVGDRRRVSVIGAVAFAVGALAGGVVTFGGLALLGDTLGAGGGIAAAVAIAALLTAAAGDAAGRRIVPQVRRQVPESWRRVLPVPVAAGLYGVLLGLGFTTFVLSFATWGLAAVCLAVGTPATGVAVGLAFGVGRAIPVGVLAPLQDHDRFAAIAEAMTERPAILRGFRLGAAALLATAATTLLIAPPEARAQSLLANGARDPSAANGLVAWQAGNAGVLLRDGQQIGLPGTHPAVGGPYVAWVAGDTIVVADPATLVPLQQIPAEDVSGLAVSDSYIAWRAPGNRGDAIYARSIAAAPEEPSLRIVSARRGGELGRPVLDGSTLVVDDQAAASSRILAENLDNRDRRTLKSAREAQVLAPSIVGGRLLYVRSSATGQQVILGNRTVYSTTPTARRDNGYEKGEHDHHQGYPKGKRPKKAKRPPKGLTVTLWTTAFDGENAYVTRLRHRSGRTESRILRVGL